MHSTSPNVSGVESPDRVAQFRHYVQESWFPCVGARSALNRGRMEFGSYRALGDEGSARALCDDLSAFSSKYRCPGADPASFVALFEQSVTDEADFTDGLWRHLQVMHDVDGLTHEWDPTVSSNPMSDAFSFSIGERAFFVVGLSPQSSRIARRAPCPCLVFNFHDQFEALKANGKYAGMQKVIRVRDIALQGFINGSLTSFGDSSEARQYAGDVTADDWVCPFKPAAPTDER